MDTCSLEKQYNKFLSKEDKLKALLKIAEEEEGELTEERKEEITKLYGKTEGFVEVLAHFFNGENVNNVLGAIFIFLNRLTDQLPLNLLDLVIEASENFSDQTKLKKMVREKLEGMSNDSD